MGTNKVGETSHSLEDPSKTEDPKKKSIRQRDVLAAMLVGYIVGILLMMIIHFVIQNKCTENCTTSSVGRSKFYRIFNAFILQRQISPTQIIKRY